MESKKYSRKQIVDVVLKYLPMDIDVNTLSSEVFEEKVELISKEFGIDLESLKGSRDFSILREQLVNFDSYSALNDNTLYYYQILNNLLFYVRNDIINVVVKEKVNNNQFVKNITDKEILDYDLKELNKFIKQTLSLKIVKFNEISTLRELVEFLYQYFDFGNKRIGYVPHFVDYELGQLYDMEENYFGKNYEFYDSQNSKEVEDKMFDYVNKIVDLVIEDIYEKICLKRMEIEYNNSLEEGKDVKSL